MLPAHRQGHGRCHTPVPNVPRSVFRKPDSHCLCGTTMRQYNFRRLRTAVQRLIHSETKHQRQFADSSTLERPRSTQPRSLTKRNSANVRSSNCKTSIVMLCIKTECFVQIYIFFSLLYVDSWSHC